MSGATLIPVHVTPKAARNEVAGTAVDASGREEVQVRVTAPPEGGKANKACCEAVARSIGVPKGRVRVARGETSRHKMMEVQAEAAAVEAWLAALRAR